MNFTDTILDALDFPIIVVSGEIDDLGRIVFVNDKAARLHGYNKEELLDCSLMLLEDQNEFEKVRDAAEKIFAGESVCISVVHRKKNGDELFLHSCAKLFVYENLKYILIKSDLVI